jgi:hypothetical protein
VPHGVTIINFFLYFYILVGSLSMSISCLDICRGGKVLLMQKFIYICFVVSWVDYILKYKCFMISFLFAKVVASWSKFKNCCLDICRDDKLL